MDIGQRGLQIHTVLDSLSQVMDAVQINHLALLVQNERTIREEGLGGVGPSIREVMAEDVLVEDQGEIHDFEGNLNKSVCTVVEANKPSDRISTVHSCHNHILLFLVASCDCEGRRNGKGRNVIFLSRYYLVFFLL